MPMSGTPLESRFLYWAADALSAAPQGEWFETPPTLQISSSDTGSSRPRASSRHETESGFKLIGRPIPIRRTRSSSRETTGSRRSRRRGTPTGQAQPVSPAPSAGSSQSGYADMRNNYEAEMAAAWGRHVDRGITGAGRDEITVPVERYIMPYVVDTRLTSVQQRDAIAIQQSNCRAELFRRGARREDISYEEYYDPATDRLHCYVSAPVPVTDDPAIRLAFSRMEGRLGDWFTVPRPRTARPNVPEPAAGAASPRGPVGPERATPRRSSPYLPAAGDPRGSSATPGRGAGGSPSPSQRPVTFDDYLRWTLTRPPVA